jgi:hypothetical protein
MHVNNYHLPAYHETINSYICKYYQSISETPYTCNLLTWDYKGRSTPKLRFGRHIDHHHLSQASFRKIARAKDLCLCPQTLPGMQFFLPKTCIPL